ncbi:MAG TPA: DUF2188 domain-containing protein [Caulobacteraceae bacterium]|nr:DUF2188 domain-containing protein [Caulobacteraceae bacterium]
MPRSTSPKRPTAKSARRLHVYPGEVGWRVRPGDSDRASGVYGTQEEAKAAAEAALRRTGGELRIQGKNGQIRDTMTLGREPMAKIAAVEGIHMSKAMQRTLDELDRKGVSGDERRRAIAAEFGKKR